jgi:pimeloyl-ACP methyl ester carboxylesterase
MALHEVPHEGPFMAFETQAASIPGFSSQKTTINGVTLHYWLGGDPQGDPVILWHGFLATGYVWRDVGPPLARAGYAVLIPDMRGYGDSDKPQGSDGYDARSLANECRALVQHLNFAHAAPIIHVAHDMGALPALLWAADYPDEVAGLLYIEGPVMLGDVLRNIIAYTPQAMKEGSLWWWILPFAPGVPERLIVGNERAFLTWFYEGHTVQKHAITPQALQEYLRTFAGREGVLGSLGIYRSAFQSIAQTEPLIKNKVQVPAVAMGGAKGLGANVAQMVRMVASNVKEVVLADSGHFVPEERPDAVVDEVLALQQQIRGRELAKEQAANTRGVSHNKTL